MKPKRDRQRHHNGTGMGTWPWSARQWHWVVTWKKELDRWGYSHICKNRSEARRFAKGLRQQAGTRDVRVNYTCEIVKP